MVRNQSFTLEIEGGGLGRVYWFKCGLTLDGTDLKNKYLTQTELSVDAAVDSTDPFDETPSPSRLR